MAQLLTERNDPEDAPETYNCNFYLYAQTTDGHLFQSPLIRTSDPKHHAHGPPPS
jgi:hypothetical protein